MFFHTINYRECYGRALYSSQNMSEVHSHNCTLVFFADGLIRRGNGNSFCGSCFARKGNYAAPNVTNSCRKPKRPKGFYLRRILNRLWNGDLFGYRTETSCVTGCSNIMSLEIFLLLLQDWYFQSVVIGAVKYYSPQFCKNNWKIWFFPVVC